MVASETDEKSKSIYADYEKPKLTDSAYDTYDEFGNFSYISVIKNPTEYHPLHLVVEPSKFVISSEGTKFSIKSLNTHKQDLIVTCTSYLYHIKSPRGHYGMKSQVFHRMKQNESVQFEICERDSSDAVADKDIGKSPSFADGYVEIIHYRTANENETGDTDADWKVKEPHQMVIPAVYLNEIYGNWKDVLVPAVVTEDMKKKRAEFVIKYMKHREREDISKFEEQVKGAQMMTKEVKYFKHVEKSEKKTTPTPPPPKKKKKKCLIQ